MMMSLGLFVFQLHTASYQELQRQTTWRHPSNSRVGAMPAYQYVGKGEDSITLSGVIYPEIAGYAQSLDVLRKMADTGKAYILIEGTGKIYGFAIIESISENKSVFFKDGLARKIEFTINLKIIKPYQLSKNGAILGFLVNVGNKLL